MNSETAAMAEAEQILKQAGTQLEALCGQFDNLENQQMKLIHTLDKILDYADKLEIERNAWRFKAEELERELRAARRDKAELAARTGEARCPECGGGSIALVRHEDGFQLDCQECGHKEEIP